MSGACPTNSYQNCQNLVNKEQNGTFFSKLSEHHSGAPNTVAAQSLKVAKSTDLLNSGKVTSSSTSMHSQFCQMTQYSFFSRDHLIYKWPNSAF